MESKPKTLKFVADASWLVESEFSTNTRHILLDMGKLVIGTASNKLFVVSDRDDKNEALLERLKPVAQKIDGNLYLVFVPHPGIWHCLKDGSKGPVLYWWNSKEGRFCRSSGIKRAL